MKIKELAATRIRYGYRRIHVLLRREGWKSITRLEVAAQAFFKKYKSIDIRKFSGGHRSTECALRQKWRTGTAFQPMVRKS